jgi:hypothetical protein
MKTYFFALLNLILFSCIASAQQITVKVTENGKAVVGHNVTVSQNGQTVGNGQTDSKGIAKIQTDNLYGSRVDVEGKYQSAGNKRSWSIKGKLALDSKNTVNIKLEEIGSGLDLGNHHNKHKESPKNDDNEQAQGGGNERSQGRGNSTESNSGTAMSGSSFQKAIKDIENTMSEFSKADKAKDLARSNNLSSAQIKQLISSLNSTFSQKDIAIIAFDNCTDPKNYKIVTEVFISSIMRREVEAATINK